MIRIAITAAAFDTITDTLPLGRIMYDTRAVHLALSRLDALRQPGEGYSGVILRMAEIEASWVGRKRWQRSSTQRISWHRAGKPSLTKSVALDFP